ncbi:MAG: glycine zipper 2TM domain-containing protein [Methylobacter sp.]|nr:glycine zipper 2TM domain-containing protein [Methylobacter sp.]
MKKLLLLIQLTAVVILFSPLSYADSDSGHRGHGWGHHKHHKHHRHYDDYYVQPQVRYYYPQPEVRYYQQPPVRYYQQPQYSNDSRSHQGLAGGVIGSVFGYELGSGDPVATGLGAAAGSFLGNEVGERRRW